VPTKIPQNDAGLDVAMAWAIHALQKLSTCCDKLRRVRRCLQKKMLPSGVVLRKSRPMAVGVQKDTHFVGRQSAVAQTGGSTADILAYDVFKFPWIFDGARKGSGIGYLLSPWGRRLQCAAGNTMELPPQSASGDTAQVFFHPYLAEIEQLLNPFYVKVLEFFAVSMSDSPKLRDGQIRQRSLYTGFGVQPEYPLRLRNTFGQVGGNLGQCFGWTDADRNRNAGHSLDLFLQRNGPVPKRHCVSLYLEERFINGVYFNLGAEASQALHHAPRYVGVELIVGGKNRDVMLCNGFLYFENRDAKGDAQAFGHKATGNNTAVVVGQDDQRVVAQLRSEQLFTGSIKTGTVHQCEIVSPFFTVWGYGRCRTHVTTPHTLRDSPQA